MKHSLCRLDSIVAKWSNILMISYFLTFLTTLITCSKEHLHIIRNLCLHGWIYYPFRRMASTSLPMNFEMLSVLDIGNHYYNYPLLTMAVGHFLQQDMSLIVRKAVKSLNVITRSVISFLTSLLSFGLKLPRNPSFKKAVLILPGPLLWLIWVPEVTGSHSPWPYLILELWTLMHLHI